MSPTLMGRSASARNHLAILTSSSGAETGSFIGVGGTAWRSHQRSRDANSQVLHARAGDRPAQRRSRPDRKPRRSKRSRRLGENLEEVLAVAFDIERMAATRAAIEDWFAQTAAGVDTQWRIQLARAEWTEPTV